MRYEKGHKDASRERIIEAASRRFRSEGVAAVGIATIMADAGLTNGAFYTHFASKEALVRETAVRALASRQLSLRGVGDSPAAIEAAVREYLSPAHRDHPELGCASAALLPEVARQPNATRQDYGAELGTIVDLIAGLLPPSNEPAQRQRRAWAIYGALIGTLQLARAVPDRALSDEILAGGVEAALALLATENPPPRRRATS